MAVLNDFGQAAYDKIVNQATEMANRLGIQPEIIIQYINDTAHFPQTLDELVNWGNTPDPVYHYRRRQANGVWTPLYPGPTPNTGGPNDPGFRHVINNSVDKLERFLNVDPSGNIWGGSVDPAYNAAHAAELGGGRSGFDTSNVMSGAGTRFSAQSANPFAGTPYEGAYEQANPSGSAGTPTPQSSGSGYAVPMGGGSYQTPNGPKSLDQMTQELRNAGYPGPFDEASVVAAYNRTAGGGGGGSNGGGGGGNNGGINDLIDARLNGNQQRFDQIDMPTAQAQIDQIRNAIALSKNADQRAQLTLQLQQAQQAFNQQQALNNRYDQNRQFDLGRYDTNRQYDLNRYDTQRLAEENRYDQQIANDRSLYSNLSQNLLNAAVNLGSRPADYFKYNQMLAGGKDIFQQLYGDQPVAEFSGFSGGQPQAGDVGSLMAALGMRQIPGVAGPASDAREKDFVSSRVGAAPTFGPEPNYPAMASATDERADAMGKMQTARDAWNQGLKTYGVATFQPQDPRLLSMYQNIFNLDPAGASAVSQKAYDYRRSVGQVASDAQFAGWVADARAQQKQPDPMAYLKNGGRQAAGSFAGF